MEPVAGIRGLLLLMAIVLFWVVQAFFLGSIADRNIARPIVSWTVLFLILPIGSHLAYGFLYAASLRRTRKARIEQRILGPPSASFPHIEHRLLDYSSPPDVTPFEKASTSQQGQPEADFILLHYRDKKVEELMEWNQWGVALKLVEAKIRDAQSAGDRKTEQVYQAYLDLIKPRIGRPIG